MHAFAPKERRERGRCRRTSDSEERMTRPLQSVRTANTLPAVQAKCSCGGGCPRCLGHRHVQAQLKVGAPGDKYEQEADRVADQVMRMPDLIRRKPG